MTQFYVDKDGKCSYPPPLYFFLRRRKGLLIHFLFVFVGNERVLSLEMVLWGKYKGDLQYREVPLVEILPPPVSASRALTLAAPPVTGNEWFVHQVDLVLVDAVVKYVSHDDPTP